MVFPLFTPETVPLDGKGVGMAFMCDCAFSWLKFNALLSALRLLEIKQVL
jgi:hypothetical protein